jgi:hypothetical protein
MRTLLVVTALVEAPVGAMLMLAPPTVTASLLGTPVDGPAVLIVARIAGAAVLALGLACWLARNDGPSRATRGVVAAMLLYNVAMVALLAYAVAAEHLGGILVWPAVPLHAWLAGWCVAVLLRR